MAADASIFQSLIQPPKSVVDYQNEYDQRDALRTRNALQALNFQQQNDQVQQGLAEHNALRRIAQSSGGDADAFLKGLDSSGMPGLMTMADTKRKAIADAAHLQAQTAAQNATAGQTNQATAIKARQDAYAEAAALNTPEDAIGALNRAVAAGKVPMQIVPAFQRMVTTDPQWKLKLLQGALDPEKLKEALMPHFTAAGGSLVNTNPLAGPMGQGAPNAIPITQSADNIANNRQSAANVATTQAGENLRAGVMPGGGLDANTERTAQAVANGQLPAPGGMALLNPKNQRVLGRVMEINPQYDSTTVDAKKTAARSFASGPLGNALRSVSTANAHLDQLGELADAMGNGNTQIINKVGNYFATQTGDPKVTNFDAIKNIVGQEVVKAIVAGGGSAGERDEAAKIFSSASSPAQLKGAIQHYRMVMGAQANNLMEQRRAAGLPNSTLPNYNTAASGANADLHKQADAILNGGK